MSKIKILISTISVLVFLALAIYSLKNGYPIPFVISLYMLAFSGYALTTQVKV